jgi:hypothetical protein
MKTDFDFCSLIINKKMQQNFCYELYSEDSNNIRKKGMDNIEILPEHYHKPNSNF